MELLPQQELNELINATSLTRETVADIIKAWNANPYQREYEAALYNICNDFLNTEDGAIKEYIWTVIARDVWASHIARQFIPIDERKWLRAYSPKGWAEIIDVHYADCVYVESKFTGKYGTQFWVNINNSNDTLYALPCRKDLTDKLEAGKCYKCTEADMEQGRGYTHFHYEFEEISEETFLKSIKRWRLDG